MGQGAHLVPAKGAGPGSPSDTTSQVLHEASAKSRCMTLRLEIFRKGKPEGWQANGGGFEKDLGDSAGGKTRVPRGEPGGAPGESPLVLSESGALE